MVVIVNVVLFVILSGLKNESIWLAYYVSLSRPRSFNQLLSHGLPDRNVIESGPPEQIAKAFEELFSEKIATTKIASAKARQALGWPARAMRSREMHARCFSACVLVILVSTLVGLHVRGASQPAALCNALYNCTEGAY